MKPSCMTWMLLPAVVLATGCARQRIEPEPAIKPWSQRLLLNLVWDVAVAPDQSVWCVGEVTPGLAGQGDGMLVHLNKAGEPLAYLPVATPAADDAKAIAIGPHGEVYVTGSTQGEMASGPSGDWDAYLLALTPDGVLRWGQQIGTAERDRPQAVAIHESRIFVTGFTAGVMAEADTEAGGQDVFLAAFSASGERLWTRQFGGLSTDIVFDMVANEHGIWLCGGTWPTGKRRRSDAFVARYGLDGTFHWLRAFGDDGDTQEEARSVAVTPDGIAYVMGLTPRRGMLLAAFNRDGEPLWSRTADPGEPGGLHLLNDHVLATGTTSENWAGEPGNINAVFVARYSRHDGRLVAATTLPVEGRNIESGSALAHHGVLVVGSRDAAPGLPGRTGYVIRAPLPADMHDDLKLWTPHVLEWKYFENEQEN